jgi:serine phosphatase RsbU (regulator of sigma subunit)
MMKHVERNKGRRANDQAHRLLEATLAFCGQQPRDDIAIVVARFN